VTHSAVCHEDTKTEASKCIGKQQCSLERDEARRVGGTNTGATVLDRLVRDRKLAREVANHFGLDFDTVEGLAVVNTDNTANHLGNNNAIPKVRLHDLRLLIRTSGLFSSAQLLDQVGVLLLDAALQVAPAGTARQQIDELLLAQVQEVLEIDPTVRKLTEGTLLGCGAHLRELQKAVKSFNFDVIVGESSKRFFRGIGMASGPNLNEHLHPSLHNSGALLSKSVDRFGATIEQILIKHGKSIRDEQFIVHRIGEVTIDLFSMAAGLSRCTQAFKKQRSSAVHESHLVNIWCEEAYDRINHNLNLILNPAFAARTKLMTTLAREIIDKEATVPGHPLDI